MPTEPNYDHLFALVAVGGGLVLIGLSFLLFRFATYGKRLLALTIIACLSYGFLFALNLGATSIRLGLVTGLPCLALLALVTGPYGISFLKLLQKPIYLGLLTVATGVGFLIFADRRYESSVDHQYFESERQLELLNWRPLGTRAQQVTTVTDRGTEIPVTEALEPRSRHQIEQDEILSLTTLNKNDSTIRMQPARDGSNCHGWTFARNLYSVSNQAVDTILTENGYTVVTSPQSGDLVVYRGPDQQVSHTAIVRYVSSGLPVLVEGKWGWMGVYLHDVEKSCYGLNYAYYRSPRVGHTLRGLDPGTYAIPAK